MNKETKIAIIGVYYGEFPDWMQYWLKSCKDNATIDFYIVTDIKNIELPINVHIIDLKFNELKKLIEKKLKMKVSLEKPYKICDYRPVYGIIFEDYLKEYDYWGHCDFDLIWGDIRSFVEKYKIEKYDKFLPLGHLSLYKNNKKCNEYYKLDGSECGNYKKVFTSDNNFAFDETGGIYSIYLNNKLPMFTKRIFAEIKTFHKRFRLSKTDKNYYNQVFYYENGKVYRAYKQKKEIKKDEYIYIHFRRKLIADKLLKYDNINNFYITNNGFIEKKDDEISIEDIKKYNHNPGILVEGFETLNFCIKNFSKLSDRLIYEIKKFIKI